MLFSDQKLSVYMRLKRFRKLNSLPILKYGLSSTKQSSLFKFCRRSEHTLLCASVFLTLILGSCGKKRWIGGFGLTQLPLPSAWPRSLLCAGKRNIEIFPWTCKEGSLWMKWVCGARRCNLSLLTAPNFHSLIFSHTLKYELKLLLI